MERFISGIILKLLFDIDLSALLHSNLFHLSAGSVEMTGMHHIHTYLIKSLLCWSLNGLSFRAKSRFTGTKPRNLYNFIRSLPACGRQAHPSTQIYSIWVPDRSRWQANIIFIKFLIWRITILIFELVDIHREDFLIILFRS